MRLTMDYEKAYKNALERARKINSGEGVPAPPGYSVCETIFPELKESEDERNQRIKKEVIEMLHYYHSKSPCFIPPQFSLEETLAWLEKQGEQKPIMIQWTGDNLKELVHFTGKSPKFEEWFKTWEDFENYVHTHNNIFKIFNEDGNHVEVPVGAWIIKTPDGYNVASRYVFKQKPADEIEPKFKVGDWVAAADDNGNMIIERVVEFLGNKVRLVDTDGVYTLCPQIWLNDYHLWTIQDAKDGDVLSNGKMIIIFKHFEKPSYRQHIVAYIGLDTSGDIQITDDTWVLGIDKAKPATKEQRDILFQKMKEAGYEWDDEKKELKKIEQKHDIVPKFRVGDTIRFKGNETLKGEDKTHRIIDYDNELYVFDDGTTDLFSEQNLYELVEQKQDWSEGDKKMINLLIKIFEVNHPNEHFKVNPIGTANMETVSTKEIVDWLKSIKPQKRWKPSEEQMEAIKFCCANFEEYDALQSLYNDLKSL